MLKYVKTQNSHKLDIYVKSNTTNMKKKHVHNTLLGIDPSRSPMKMFI